MSRVWKIAGCDGSKTMWEGEVPFGMMSESEMEVLLKRLAAKHLHQDEIVASSLRKNAKGRMNHLDVRGNIGGKPALMTMGTGRHYTARIVEGDDNRAAARKPPKESRKKRERGNGS